MTVLGEAAWVERAVMGAVGALTASTRRIENRR